MVKRQRARRAKIELVRETSTIYSANGSDVPETPIDFSASPEVVRVVVEGERLTYGHLFNPTFATEISRIVPLPHQRLAVYDSLLPQHRLRFLLADDAGAGKTIMTGLYLREMLSRRLISRILIVCPAGLVGNWERELRQLFNLQATILEGADARDEENPFVGEESNLVIVSVDTLCGERMFARLQESEVLPYDIAVFDEAHKLAADREADLLPSNLTTVWNGHGEVTALDMADALSAKVGVPLPWFTVRQAIDAAINARYIALAVDSGRWPCDYAHAATVKLRDRNAPVQPTSPIQTAQSPTESTTGSTVIERTPDYNAPSTSVSPNTLVAEANLTPAEIQNLEEQMSDIMRLCTANNLRPTFHMRIEISGASSLPNEKIVELSSLLQEVSERLRLS